MKILFVCMANIVRSFIAERILKRKLEKINRKGVDVSSAGLIDMDGMPADPIAAGILSDHGFEGTNRCTGIWACRVMKTPNGSGKGRFPYRSTLP